MAVTVCVRVRVWTCALSRAAWRPSQTPRGRAGPLQGTLGISGDASWEGRGHVLEPPGPGVVEAEGAVTSLGSVQPKTDPRGERPVRWLGQGPHFTPPMERQTAEDSDGVTLTCVARRACRACLERALRKDSASSSRTGVRYDLQGEQPDQA